MAISNKILHDLKRIAHTLRLFAKELDRLYADIEKECKEKKDG